MSESYYHKQVKNTIIELAKGSKKYKRILKEKTIPIVHPNKGFIIRYNPEIILITTSGGKYIFEVLGSQLRDYNLILSDIIQAFISENVKKVFFISKTKAGADLTKNLSRTLGAALEEHGFYKRDLPEVTVYEITYKDVKSKNNLKKILKEYSKKDKW